MNSKVNALWRWKDDPNHYLINEMNTIDWFEVQNGQVIFKYVLWDVDHSFSKGPIIYDDSRKIFIEIFDNSLIYGFNDVSNLNHGDFGAFGDWAIKPGFENPIVPLIFVLLHKFTKKSWDDFIKFFCFVS
jgi:hypothetical protein